MSQMVVFNELWLLSERDASARQLRFNHRKNLLAGSNGTGKSRAVKHMVWALGCEPPKRIAAEFDSNVVVALNATVGGKVRTFVRQNRERAAFNEDGQLLFATASASKWNQFFAETFDFPLKLQRQDDGGFDLAGPSYALLPFYIDQDGSWGLKWSTFTNLGQFPKWQTPVFNSFSGLKPAAYVRNQLLRDEVAFHLRNAKIEAKVQNSSYERVVAMLPPESTVVDETAFAKQLQELAADAQGLKSAQEEVRRELLALAQEREQRSSELNLALNSERDLVEDLAYLSDFKEDAQLICPTCLHVHTTSFRAKEVLAADAQEMHEVVVKLQRQIENARTKEVALQVKLNNVASRLHKLNSMMSKRQGGQAVADIVAAKSRLTLQAAYDITRNDVAARIDSLAGEQKELDDELAKLTDKGREKNVKVFFKECVLSFASKLDIHKAELGTRMTIGARPPGASGSYAPRAVLATHLALIATHRQFGVGSSFPFIVDTPQQSGQDPESLGRMLNAILNDSAAGQTLVATESIPEGWQPPQDCSVINLQKKRQLLQPSEYRDGIAALGDLVRQMREAVLAEAVQEEEPEPVNSPDGDEEDDNE
ncbi:hypothetical protein [Delftia lacustris]|uniref:hypothetical protein n=1 Tax=Delftia lacustris TaxID=558537 RepID=UPI002862145B|nr:hypothetical protein [Delftia lacustris]MDR6731843.1 uncharacterized Zn finger protein (UPF0148 family)/energy-coupling factor transporter ATP-binding protein EcfA2 [Delftia lacustris]